MFSRYLYFCLDFLDMKKNRLMKNTWLISKFMTSRTGKHTNAIHVLPNISRSKCNQTMIFCRLIKYITWETFLKNQTQDVVEKVVLDQISGLVVQNFMQFVFIVYQVEGYWKILKLICRLLTITSHKAFLKNIKRSETCYILLPDQVSLSGCFYVVRYWAICVL